MVNDESLRKDRTFCAVLWVLVIYSFMLDFTSRVVLGLCWDKTEESGLWYLLEHQENQLANPDGGTAVQTPIVTPRAHHQ